jgi:hypothetical protein
MFYTKERIATPVTAQLLWKRKRVMSERGNDKSALVGDTNDHFVKVRVTGYVTYRFQNNMTGGEFEEWAEANVDRFDQMTNRSLDRIDYHLIEIETRPLERKQA